MILLSTTGGNLNKNVILLQIIGGSFTIQSLKLLLLWCHALSLRFNLQKAPNSLQQEALKTIQTFIFSSFKSKNAPHLRPPHHFKN